MNGRMKRTRRNRMPSKHSLATASLASMERHRPPHSNAKLAENKEGPPHFGSRLGARAPRPRACGAGGRRAGAHGEPRGGSRVPPPFFPGGGVPRPPRPPAPARGASAVGRGRYPPIAVWADRGGGAARAGRGPREPPRPQPTPVLRPGGSALTGARPRSHARRTVLFGRTDGRTDRRSEGLVGPPSVAFRRGTCWPRCLGT